MAAKIYIYFICVFMIIFLSEPLSLVWRIVLLFRLLGDAKITLKKILFPSFTFN